MARLTRLRLVITALVALLIVMPVWSPVRYLARAAQTLDATAWNGGFSAVTERTWDHVMGSGANGCVFLNVFTGTASVLTAVKWGGSGGTNFTQIGTTNNMGSGLHHAYKLMAPATGTQQVYIASSVSDFIAGESVSYTDCGDNDATIVDQSTNGSAATSYSGSLTTVTNNSWVVMLGACEGGNIAASTGSTLRQKNLSTLSSGIFDSNSAITPAGSYSMEFTCSLGDNSMFMVAMPPPGGGGSPRKCLIGGGFLCDE